MNLRNSVQRFAQETITDPYGVGSSFLAHFSVFDDEKSSGLSTRRRILETLPTVSMYSTNCITHAGKQYIVGSPNYDYHRGTSVRVKYPIIPCDFQYKLATILQILTSAVTTTVTYASIDQIKNSVADSETSNAVTGYVAYLTPNTTITKGQILISGSLYYRIKSDPWIDGAGFVNVELVLLTSPFQSVTFTVASGYDTVTDTIVNGTSYSNTKIFVEDAYYAYEHTSARYAQIKPGDKNITIKPSVVPKPTDVIGAYKILTVDTVGDGTYSCHCRR